MKLKNMKFTEKTLVDIDACQGAIDFCIRNGLFCNTQIKNLEIAGEYKGWAAWINRKSDWDLGYNTAGNLVKITRSIREIETRKYDASGNPVEIINWDGTTETRKYDASGNLVETINRKGMVETRKYNIAGNLVEIRYSSGKTKILIKYDTSGNLVKIKYSNGMTETYEYDITGNLTKITYPNDEIETYEYERTEKKFIMRCNGKTVLKIHNLEGWA